MVNLAISGLNLNAKNKYIRHKYDSFGMNNKRRDINLNQTCWPLTTNDELDNVQVLCI